jgi:hypothetical protein
LVEAKARIDRYRRAAQYIIDHNGDPADVENLNKAATAEEDKFWQDVTNPAERTRLGLLPGQAVQRNLITNKLGNITQAPSNIAVTTQAESSEAGAFGGGVGKIASDTVAAGQAAKDRLRGYDTTLAALKEAPAGTGANLRLELGVLANTLGIGDKFKGILGSAPAGEIAESQFAQMADAYADQFKGRLSGGALTLVREAAPELMKSRPGQEALVRLAKWGDEQTAGTGDILLKHFQNPNPSGRGGLLPSQKDPQGKTAFDKIDEFRRNTGSPPQEVMDIIKGATEKSSVLMDNKFIQPQEMTLDQLRRITPEMQAKLPRSTRQALSDRWDALTAPKTAQPQPQPQGAQ